MGWFVCFWLLFLFLLDFLIQNINSIIQRKNTSDLPQGLNFQNLSTLSETFHCTIFIFPCEAVLQMCVKSTQVFNKKIIQNNTQEFSLMRRKEICFQMPLCANLAADHIA